MPPSINRIAHGGETSEPASARKRYPAMRRRADQEIGRLTQA
jgi:hypothetical protein